MSVLRRQLKDAKATYYCAWVELGRLLNEVVYGGDYKEWGYDDFEVYCARELKLAKATVRKLMISYNYLKKRRAGLLESFEDGAGDGERPEVPPFETVATLHRLLDREDIPESRLEDLEARVFSDPHDEAAQKEVKSLAIQPRKPADPDRADKAKVLKVAREFRRVIQPSHFVPKGLKERIEQPLVELEALD